MHKHDQEPSKELGRFQTPFGLAVAVRHFYCMNDAVAIELCSSDQQEGVLAMLSVNLPEHASLLKQDEFFVETWRGNASLIEPARASGLFEDTGRVGPYVRQTGVQAPIWRIRQPAASPSDNAGPREQPVASQTGRGQDAT